MIRATVSLDLVPNLQAIAGGSVRRLGRDTDFRAAEVKERKQAEFLLQARFPFHLVERIGVHSAAIHGRVTAAIMASRHRPAIEVRPEWYF